MKFIVLYLLFNFACQVAMAQNFYSYLVNHLDTIPQTHGTSVENKENVELLKAMLGKVEKKDKKSILNTDSLYMITYQEYNFHKGYISMLVWNKKQSCHFAYAYITDSLNHKINHATNFELNANKRINGLNPQLRKWIECADISSYKSYKMARYKKVKSKEDSLRRLHIYTSHPLLSSVSLMFFTIAVKQNSDWKFISSPMYQVE